MTEKHAICHKIDSTLRNKVTINATFTSLMSSMPSHSLCYAKLVQHRFVTSLILNFSEKMFCFCNVNLNNCESSKYHNILTFYRGLVLYIFVCSNLYLYLFTDQMLLYQLVICDVTVFVQLFSKMVNPVIQPMLYKCT